MPTRSISTLTGVPPADAIKADEDAVSDVYDQVSQTGSLAKAAVKLQKYAQAWEDDPEEKEYLEAQRNKQRDIQESLPTQAQGPAPKMSLAQQRMMQAFADEEGGDEPGDVEMDVDGRNTISVFEREEEEEEEGGFEEPGVTHLQEIQEGLWIGDLVAAMDTAGLEERGIVSHSPLPSCSADTIDRPTLYLCSDLDYPFLPNSTSMPSKLTMPPIQISSPTSPAL
jgi:dual specificity phosphatase 12